MDKASSGDPPSRTRLVPDIIRIMLQWLREQDYNEAATAYAISNVVGCLLLIRLEANSQIFFNLEYLRSSVIEGNLDDADRYLSHFLEIDVKDDAAILFLLRRLKYFEALFRYTQPNIG